MSINRSGPSWWTAAAAALLVCWSSGALALDLRSVLTGYSITGWGERDGVRLGPVRALARTRDGYLWLGTDSGLVRFDGVRFRSWTFDDFASAPITALHADSTGGLWVAISGATGIRRIRDGRVETTAGSAPTGTIASFAADRTGTLWAGGSDGLFALKAGQWRHFGAADGLSPLDIQSLLATADGNLWIGSPTGLYRWAGPGSRLQQVRTGRVRGLTEDAARRVWAGDFTIGLAAADGFRHALPARQGRGNQLLYDHDGNLWVGTLGQGLWRIRKAESASAPIEVATVEVGLLNDGIWSLLEDEHGIWVGTNEGLNLLTPYQATPVVNLGIVNSIEVADPHSLLVGTARGLYKVSVDDPQSIAGQPKLPDLEISVVHRDGDGVIWLITPQGFGRIVGDRFVRSVAAVPLAPDGFTSVVSDRRKRVWVAHRDAGVLRVVDEHLVPLAKTNSRHFDDITLLHAASDGGLWVIYNGGREIGVIDSAGQVIDDVKGRPPLGPTSVITAVVETRSKDLWFATTTGILRFRRGTWSEFGSAQGLPAQEVTAIAEDNRGSLWLAMAVGPLLMIDPSSADAVAAGHEGVLRYVTLDQSDGVAGVAVRRPGPRVVRADNGTLWFTTGRGMTVVDPRTARASVAAPDGLVAIEEAVVDDRPVSVTPMAMLPPNVGRMRIDYTALNVRWPGRFRFRYRLDGFDTEWTDAGTARQATYTNLGPGHYRFQVEAQSEKSRQTLLANAWEFSVAPAFYQTRTFAVAVIAALGLALWGAWQLRLLQVRRRFAQVLAERARMSRELHDTLLQSLAGVALQIGDAVADLDHDPDVVRAQLARIRKQVEQHTAEAASTITQLRSPLLRDHDLPAAIREMIRRVTEGQPWQVDVNVTGRVGELPEVVQHHVLRVAQEALTNVVRHAHASQVAVVVRFEPAQVLLEVSDDGAGFIPEEVPLGDRTHFGLTMMRERAEQVGGRLTIESGGRGTRVILTVPRAARLRKVS